VFTSQGSKVIKRALTSAIATTRSVGPLSRVQNFPCFFFAVDSQGSKIIQRALKSAM